MIGPWPSSTPSSARAFPPRGGAPPPGRRSRRPRRRSAISVAWRCCTPAPPSAPTTSRSTGPRSGSSSRSSPPASLEGSLLLDPYFLQHDVGVRPIADRGHLRDGVRHVLALDHDAEDGVLAVQPRGGADGD